MMLPSYWWQSETFPVELVFPFFFLNHSGRHPLGFLDNPTHRASQQKWYISLFFHGTPTQAGKPGWHEFPEAHFSALSPETVLCCNKRDHFWPSMQGETEPRRMPFLFLDEEQEIGGWMVFHHRKRLNRKISVTEIILNMRYVPDLPCWPAYDCMTKAGHLTTYTLWTISLALIQP